MKPEELDELFRRGLAGQPAPPPRPTAWATVQQRMAATPDADAEDELPAFLRTGVPAAPALMTPAAPLMTAVRGGGALARTTSATPGAAAWWQRPALRAAAAVVLLVGGGVLVLRENTPDSDPMVAVAPTSVPAVAFLQPNSLAAASDAAPVAPTATVAAAPTAPVVAENSAENSAETLVNRPVTAPTPASSREVAPVVAAAPRRVARRSPVSMAQQADPATAVAFAAADSVPRVANLLAEAVMEITIRPAAGAQPAAGYAQPATFARTVAGVDGTDAEGRVAVEGEVGRWVSRATGRELRITSPHTLLRRASGRMRDLLDRADHTTDGQLTLETSLAGRPIRKTISL